jgi:MinD superfamily P-loop ATPase
MHEVVVISGKGGTGKTSLVASFAALAGRCVVADADVDAADLHLVLAPSLREEEDYVGGSRARILSERCTGCGKCEELCRFEAVSGEGTTGEGEIGYRVDPIACEGCGVCAYFCPEDAIEFLPVVSGRLFVSETRWGPFVHARLGAAQENSGKLVTLVRTRARTVAKEHELDLVLSDGAPGVGCPVIASLTGADFVVIVTEPTLSGLHDLQRVMALTSHFGARVFVCVNKWDLNEQLATEIESWAQGRGASILGRIRYDAAVTAAQVAGIPLVEYCEQGAAADLRNVWLALGAEVARTERDASKEPARKGTEGIHGGIA